MLISFVSLHVIFVPCCVCLFSLPGLYTWNLFFWFPLQSWFPWLFFYYYFFYSNYRADRQTDKQTDRETDLQSNTIPSCWGTQMPSQLLSNNTCIIQTNTFLTTYNYLKHTNQVIILINKIMSDFQNFHLFTWSVFARKV